VTAKVSALLNSVAAIVLAYTTLIVVHATASPGLRDVLAMPGAVLGSAGGIVGLYDIPSGSWAVVCLAGNLLFYSAVWWLAIYIAARRRRLAHE
jgi:hypothetical protein